MKFEANQNLLNGVGGQSLRDMKRDEELAESVGLDKPEEINFDRVVFVSGSSSFSSYSGVCSLSEFLLLLAANQDVEKLVCPRFIAQLNQTLLATTWGHINIKNINKDEIKLLI